MYRLIFDRFIVHLDPELAHEHTLKALQVMQVNPLGRAVLALVAGAKSKDQVPARKLGGPLARPIPSPVGLAAGMDKDGKCIEAFSRLGFGFVEVGTITPRPQEGNLKPRLWRLPAERTLRNAMGFNNEGAKAAGQRLKQLRMNRRTRSIVVGANIGKNKTTPPDKAIDDYAAVTKVVARWVDYLVINVSSPNTPGLRDLQNVQALTPIARAVQEQALKTAGRNLPVLVKISPDLHPETISQVCTMVKELSLGGVVATNTTIDHTLGAGGLSGPVLIDKSVPIVRQLRRELGPDPIIIGVGGVGGVEEGRQIIEAGADLVEILTAFVYDGPRLPGKLSRALSNRYWPELRK